MTQEDKELLLKDLCTRLPYGVKINETIQGDFTLIGLTTERVFTTCEVEGSHNDFPIECIKPYLFPLSSMTDKDLVEFLQIKGMNLNTDELKTFRRGKTVIVSTLPSYSRHIDWLNKKHFDYRGLIEKGLAIDATEKSIY